MVLPFNEKITVVDLELSNKNFISTIESDVQKTNPRSISFDRYIYPSDYCLAEFSSRVYSEQGNCADPLGQGWVLLMTASNKDDGYFGAAYWNSECKQVVIAHKGTQNPYDLWADYQGILSNEYTSQMNSAATFSHYVATMIKQLNKKYSTNLTLSVTGHSLGGWLAQVSAFTIQYLVPQFFDYKGYIFVKSKEEGCHTHTVAFDSPGCKDMLLKMESDFDVRYSGKPHSSFFLDVTIYLSAPNLVNTLHSHLNVGNLFRVFIENLPSRTSTWDLFQYTSETHSIQKIKRVFVSERNSESREKIMKVVDWPLVNEGLGGIVLKKLFTSNQNEYERFHELANCTNYYNPSTGSDEYCALRYQVQVFNKEECSANIFTHPEFEFLNGYKILKKFSLFSTVDDLLFSLEEMAKGEIIKVEVEEILKYFEIEEGEGRGVIKCSSIEQLQKLITCVKNILFICPNMHTKIKDALKNWDVYNVVYKTQSLEYLHSIKCIEFEDATMKYLVDFLKSTDLHFLQVISKAHALIEVKRIHKVINKTANDYETFFLSLTKFQNLEQFFPVTNFLKQSDKSIPMLFVLDYDFEPRQATNLFIKLFNAFEGRPKTKFILVSQQMNTLENILEFNNNLYHEMMDYYDTKLDDLTADSQREILEKKIYFQGEELSLGSLVVGDLKHLINDEILSKLINNDAIEVGKALPDLGDVENYYIDRTFNRCVNVDKNIKESNEFYITDNSQIDKSEFKPGQDIVLISRIEEHFIELCNENEDLNVHWLTEDNECFVWQKSRGALSNLREFIDVNTDNVADCDIEGSVVIISSVSGAGKSTALTKLAQNIKKRDPALWVVKITLNNYTEKLSNEEFGKDKSEIVTFLADMANLTTILERKLFEHRLNHQGRVALLLDGFDEIVPDYKKKILELIDILKATKIEKLWITTRPHLRSLLEDKLCVLSYTLKLLSEKDQLMFFKKYWKKSLGITFTDEMYFEKFVKKLLHSISEPMSDESKEFTGIPLHTKMMAEAFQEEFKNSNHHINQNESVFPQKLNLFGLYRAFIQSKFKRHFAEKGIMDFTKPGYHNKLLFSSFLERYSLLALNSLFSEDDLNKFLNEYEMDNLCKYLEQVNEGEENLGFISHIFGAKPIFIHYSFAEYFAALFYSNNIKREKVKEFVCERICSLGTVLRSDLTRMFFDYMVADDEDKCKVHIAVLNNDRDKLEELLPCVDTRSLDINSTDRVGRTALHLATAYGYFNITNFLLNRGCDVNTKDQLFGLTPLGYADKSNNWIIAESLLEKGGNAVDLCEAKKILENFVFDNILDNKTTLLHVAARKGLKKFLNALLDDTPNLINAKDCYDRTLLHIAIDEEHEEIAKILITRGADINARYALHTPLHIAVEKGHEELSKLLLSGGADTEIGDPCMYTALHVAIGKGYKELAKILIAHGANIDAKISRGSSPLHLAIVKGYEEIAKLLVTRGADIEVKDANNFTPLPIAIFNGQEEVVKLLTARGAHFKSKDPLYGEIPLSTAMFLINQGVNPKARDGFGRTPLHIAILKGYEEIAMFLIAKGADIEAKDYSGRTPLDIAVYRGEKDIAELLIERRADIEDKETHGYTPLHIAVNRGDKVAVELLISRGDYIEARNLRGATPLHIAIGKGRQEIAKLLIPQVMNIEAKDADGYTPLQLATLKGHKDLVKLLITRGADFKTKDHCGCTPLHVAIRKGYEEVASVLITRGADTEAEDPGGYTPLHKAIDEGHVEVAKLLITRGVNIETKDPCGYTPLQRAVDKGYVEVARMLITRGAYIEAKDPTGNTPLHVAIGEGHEELAKLLIRRGADIGTKDSSGNTPLHTAICEGYKKIVKQLIRRGADIEAKDSRGWTPLHTAILGSHEEIAKLLITQSADITAKNTFGCTPLHLAVLGTHEEIVRLLLKRGADIESKDSSGRTPLHLATFNGKEEISKLLVTQGANIDAKDYRGRTPLDVAVDNGQKEFAEFLIKQRAAIEGKDHNGKTSRCTAISESYAEIAKLLMIRGVCIQDKYPYDSTPLHIAIIEGLGDIAMLLIKHGAYNNVKDLRGNSPLHIAIRGGHVEFAKLLITGKADIVDRDLSGYTPLHLAIDEDQEEIAELLIRHGADIEAKNPFGNTPLHLAICEGQKRIARLLLERGSNVEAKDFRGRTPLQAAIVEDQREIAKLLVTRGANIEARNSFGRIPLDIIHRCRKEIASIIRRANRAKYLNGPNATSS
ncbi:uncharacterized protein [Parasteatoda tepidariorum]|uniref:uncharacterized protein n=1 Tax=Parasteatoda tepidariorum TaxID=114398 RepID=UPI001C727711|nr:uncharacterized protein LOC107444013 [Parasteatoda tepidariorum]